MPDAASALPDDVASLKAMVLAQTVELVEIRALRQAQEAGDVLGAHRALMDAFETDVRPLLARVRAEMGAAADPLRAYAASGYQQKIERERIGGTAMTW